MKLYLITNKSSGPGKFDSVLVTANNEEDALKMNPASNEMLGPPVSDGSWNVDNLEINEVYFNEGIPTILMRSLCADGIEYRFLRVS